MFDDTYTAISSDTFGQTWDLDQLNNWDNFTEDNDGDATDDLVQSRTHNDANEITDITETTGPSWTTPALDAAGNMTTIPQPAAPTSSYTLTWDAWNRLVKVADGANTVAEYAYDGQNRRIVKKIYTGGTLDHTRHIYLSNDWQTLEERIDNSTNPDRQFTWGTRYIDDLVFRTRDTDGNGSLDETLYAIQDANWNITAIADTSGAVVERLVYDPYGKSTLLDADFALDSDGLSDYAWEYRFTSRECDANTGLHYFRARYYQDTLGSFIGRDPLEYIEGYSLYTAYFVPSSTDPSGLQVSGASSPYGMAAACCTLCNRTVGAGTLHSVADYGIVGSDDAGGGNAFRHCLATCRAAKTCGLSCARRFWTDREDPESRSSQQDLANNEIGFAGRSSSCCTCYCMRAWRRGDLTCTNADGEFVECPSPPTQPIPSNPSVD